jgi:hypothetical protein
MTKENRVTDTNSNLMCALGVIEKEVEKMGGHFGTHFSIEVNSNCALVTVGLNFDVVRLGEYIAQLPPKCLCND